MRERLALPSSATAVAASTVSILSGWATSVVATALITGWWRTDRLFCVGVGFLTAVFGASTIAGVVGLLLRRRVGIYLSVVAAVLALLIFSGIFIAGARMAGVVYAFPVLPVTTVVLAVAPATWRWTKPMAASGQQRRGGGRNPLWRMATYNTQFREIACDNWPLGAGGR